MTRRGRPAARRAEIATSLDDPELVATAVRPDDTDEIDTRVADGRVVATVERETTGGLRSTVDDHVVNLSVAARTARHAKRHVSNDP